MEITQAKGVAITVGATAALTAVLTGGVVAIHDYQEKASSVDTAQAFNNLQFEASSMRKSGLTDVFSDHCLTLKESVLPGATPLSWVPEITTTGPADPETGERFTTTQTDLSRLDDSYDWQWINTDRDTQYLKDRVNRFYAVDEANPYLPSYVAEPSERSQDNLNRLLHDVKAYKLDPANPKPEPAYISAGNKASQTRYNFDYATPVIAAHCRWILNMKSNAVQYATDGSQLKDDVTLSSDPTYGNDEWLIVNGQKAHVTAHGRAYYTLEKPIKGNDVPADATLIGETDLDFTAPGTQTATIDKPASLNGGYVTWVWSVEKNRQPAEWGKYLFKETTDGWSADDEVVELPKAPEPAPNVSAPTIEPSEAPTPSATTPSPEPSATTPAPTPSESQTLPPTIAPSTTPSAGSTKTPVTYTSLAHTGSTTLPLFGLSATALAGGLTLALRKRNVG